MRPSSEGREAENTAPQSSERLPASSGSDQADRVVGGRLGKYWELWSSISPYIATQLREGFRLPWISRPARLTPRQPTLNPQESAQVDREIERALEKQAIREIPDSEARCINPVFTVAKRGSEERRMIVDLREVNKLLRVPRFKTTTFREAKLLITPNCWMTKIDIKDAFWHLPVHPSDQPYLAFQWRGKTYCHQVAPFGLSISPLFLAKTMRPLMAKINSSGISSCIYVDDALIVSETQQEAQQATEYTVQTFEEAGFLVNREKSQLIPTQEIVYLGMAIDSKTMTVRAPSGKLNKAKMAIRKMLQMPSWTVRELASLLGLINSLADGLFQTRVFTSGLQQWKKCWQEGDWDKPLAPSTEALGNLGWWYDNLNQLNGRSLLPMRTEGTMTTDASLSGWGAVWESPGLDPIHTSGLFEQQQMDRHIGEKELLAVILALQAFRSQTQQKAVLLKTDSIVVMRAVNKMGSNAARIAALTDQLFLQLESQQTCLRAVYIPSEENPADRLSRQGPANSDWMLNPKIFKQCCRIWGTPAVDLFASFANRQLPRFYSFTPQPQAAGIDAFSTSWREYSWVNPPFALIHRVLNKIREDQATVLLVFPVWTASPWFNTAVKLIVDVPLVVNRSQPIHSQPMITQQSSVEPQDPGWTTCISRMSSNASEQQAWKSRWSNLSPNTLYSALEEAVLRRGNSGPFTARDYDAIHTLSLNLASSITGSPPWAHASTSGQH